MTEQQAEALSTAVEMVLWAAGEGYEDAEETWSDLVEAFGQEHVSDERAIATMRTFLQLRIHQVTSVKGGANG